MSHNKLKFLNIFIKGRVLTILLFATASAWSQNNRYNEYNTIGWYNYLGTFKINNTWSIHSEFQWRRVNLITNPQQNLIRVGVNYKPSAHVVYRLGYAFIETASFGETPINVYGKSFSEHRIFEMVQIGHQEGIFEFSHRFMLEQRFIGKYNSATATSEDGSTYVNRMRYLGKVQFPLKGKAIKLKTPYLVFYDEILIGFGKNVNQNVFDQNRIGCLIGYKFNKTFALEGGYTNVTQELGRLVNGKNVFQNNNGIIINANFNFDVSKKSKVHQK